MDSSDTVTLLMFLLPLAYSPGPGNLFFAANGARFGLRTTFNAIAGYHVATLSVTLLLGFGFSSALLVAPHVFSLIKIVGSLYVLWLAWKLGTAGSVGQQDATSATFMDGVVLLLLNPKAYVIITLMFSQFLSVDSGNVHVILISMTFTLNNLVAFTVWAMIGDRLGEVFRNESQARYLNMTFGVMLAMVGGWMLLS